MEEKNPEADSAGFAPNGINTLCILITSRAQDGSCTFKAGKRNKNNGPHQKHHFPFIWTVKAF